MTIQMATHTTPIWLRSVMPLFDNDGDDDDDDDDNDDDGEFANHRQGHEDGQRAKQHTRLSQTRR